MNSILPFITIEGGETDVDTICRPALPWGCSGSLNILHLADVRASDCDLLAQGTNGLPYLVLASLISTKCAFLHEYLVHLVSFCLKKACCHLNLSLA